MPLSDRAPFIFTAFIVAILFLGCGSDSSSNDKAPAGPVAHGKSIYSDYCRLCHGADGKLGLNNASDLASSTLSKEELKQVITHGRNTMQPYKKILSEKEIDDVTEYILTLRQ